MTLQELLNYCLKKDGAYIDFPFGGDYATVKIKNGAKSKIFAELFTLKNEPKLTFSSDAATAQLLRLQYSESITRGWHCPPVQAKYKSTVSIDKIPDNLLLELVDLSYQRAISLIPYSIE